MGRVLCLWLCYEVFLTICTLLDSIDDTVMDTTEDQKGELRVVSLPQKKYFRQRAHSNPISDHLVD